ncbi:MAG: hypothetical protein HZB91_12355 [Elusimicrobia bacterium]|nr:hypothetical protein [Elusimicrobiota bacterium]
MTNLLAVGLWLMAGGAMAQEPAIAAFGAKSQAASQLLGLTAGEGQAGFQAVSALPIGLPAVPPPSLGLPGGMAPAAASPKVFFSDEAAINTELVKAIDASKTSVEAALFGFSLIEVGEALVRAKARGVAVRVVFNQNHVFPERTRTKEVQYLIDQGIDLRTVRGTRSYGVQHAKIGIFDGKLLKMGSFNWTYAATNYNYENALFTTDPGHVAGFSAFWKYMWDLARPFSAGPIGELPPGSLPAPAPCASAVAFNGTTLPACAFSPLGGTEAVLLKAIAASKSSIDVAAYSFYSQPLADALVAARDRGVKVRVLMDKENGKKTQITRFLVGNGMDTRWMSGRGKGAMHHKYAVFDGRLVETGSHNWTNNAEQNDFEDVLLTTNSAAVKSYSRKFSELYGMAVPPTPEQLPAPEKVEGSSLAVE